MSNLIIAHAISLALDFGSTEANIANNGCDPHLYYGKPGCIRVSEQNPLPGMQSRFGRIAWGSAELTASAVIEKKSKKWGKIFHIAAIAAHGSLAGWNEIQAIRGHNFWAAAKAKR